MKRGYEYLASPEKRRMDRQILRLTAPVVKATELAVRSYMGYDPVERVSVIFDQLRIGQAAMPFVIHKFYTCDPETDKPFSPLAQKMRKLGLDEMAQAQNIREGNMSFIGWRPLVSKEYEEFREALSPRLRVRHDLVVTHSLPGEVSSYGIYSHVKGETEPNGPEMRAEMNIKDAMDASPLNDLRLAQDLIGKALSRRMQ